MACCSVALRLLHMSSLYALSGTATLHLPACRELCPKLPAYFPFGCVMWSDLNTTAKFFFLLLFFVELPIFHHMCKYDKARIGRLLGIPNNSPVLNFFSSVTWKSTHEVLYFVFFSLAHVGWKQVTYLCKTKIVFAKWKVSSSLTYVSNNNANNTTFRFDSPGNQCASILSRAFTFLTAKSRS